MSPASIIPIDPPPLSAALKRRIRSAQIASVYERMGVSATLSIVIACFFAWLLGDLFPRDTLHQWLASIAIVNLLRLALWNWYRRVGPSAEDSTRWVALFVGGIAAAGIAWSTGVLVLLPQSQGYQVAMLLVTLLCVSSVAATSLAMHFVSYCTFMLIMLVPTATWLSLQPSGIRYVAAGMWAGLGVLLVTGYSAWRSSSRLLKTEFDLAQALLTAADARTAAEDASRAKSRFLANMSHEVRTPLNGVLGMAEILGGSSLDAAQRRQVGMLQQSAQHLLGVVNDILDLAKVEAGRMQLEQGPLNLAAIVGSAVDLFRDAADRKGLQLSCSLAANLPKEVRGDGQRLRQVLANLISNAVKCTAAGVVSVEVRLDDSTVAGYRLRFTVQDTGCGIPFAAQEHVFGAFAQLVDVAPRAGGTGLGLAIARELVTLMGGQIGVESTPGEGSMFWFTATFDRCAQQSDGSTVLRSARPGLAPRTGGKILVVEDNAVNRAVIEAMLQRLQHEVSLAHDAEAALVMLERDSYDVVLMDCRLPGMDGFEATRLLRRRGMLSRSGGALPVIALTANAFAEDRRRAADAGMDDFLSKPIQLDTLDAAVGHWLAAPRCGDLESEADRIRYDSTHESKTAESG
ncbi:MAG: response regulator [Pseudomonadales bacterium]|nr:response regulator [Pseudomonadales bacterium]